MYFSDNIPRTMVGNSIDNVLLEETLVERLYIEEYISPSMNFDRAEWSFFVGVYKSNGLFYLLLDSNEYAATIEDMIENGEFPQTGFVQISKETAIDISEKLLKLGREYYRYPVPGFEKIISFITAAIPCPVTFKPMLDKGGYYDKANEEIAIANNTSQCYMIIVLIHEYVHCLLKSERMPPATAEEYIYDREEYLCNLVAYKFICSLLGVDFVKKIVSNEMQLTKATLETWKGGTNGIPPEVLFIYDTVLREKMLKKARGVRRNANRLMDKILSNLCDLNPESVKIRIDCKPIGLVKLSFADNKALYNMITEEISALMPEDICDDEDVMTI